MYEEVLRIIVDHEKYYARLRKILYIKNIFVL